MLSVHCLMPQAVCDRLPPTAKAPLTLTPMPPILPLPALALMLVQSVHTTGAADAEPAARASAAAAAVRVIQGANDMVFSCAG